jgi:pulcherriminic acid synthase
MTDEAAAGYRTYEIYQRERVGESTNLIKPRQLLGGDYLNDPYPLVAILREHYPCYRDWVQNCFWITRYDDVTSVFTDDANYQTRSKRWRIGREDLGTDLAEELSVLVAVAHRTDAAAPAIAERIAAGVHASPQRHADLATAVAGRYPLELLGAVLDLPAADLATFATRWWRMQRGAGWDPVARQDANAAIAELVAYFQPLFAQRRAAPGDDLVSAVATLGAGATDLVATLLEMDHETLHGGLANLWFLLLTHPDQLAEVSEDRRLVKFAWFEMLRHSTPVITAPRFARHEVERFGRLLPEGGLLMCSAAAANRDPRVFADPDRFHVARKDICQREPRGQYRADGLPAGVAVGLGRPSRHPAVPEDRPRSRYALTRDAAVIMTNALLDALPHLHLASSATPHLRSLRLGEMHTCWSLPVTWS